VAVHAGRRVTDVRVDADRVVITAGDVVASAEVCVLACGASYAIQRKLGLGMPRLLLHTAQCEVPADRLGDVEVHFGRDVAPRGFAWAVPVVRERPYVRIGLMCDRRAGAHFGRLSARLASRWGIDADRLEPRQKILPLGPIDRTYTDRVVVIGDAAGLVKPTTGGGIYYSLMSAQLAVEALVPALEAGRVDAAALAAYEKRWRAEIGRELRWQLTLRRIASRLSDEDIDGLFELARTDGIMPLVRRTAAFNHHREFIAALFKHPPARRVLLRAVFA
jgi:flavin-dependent dehydrogenase